MGKIGYRHGDPGQPVLVVWADENTALIAGLSAVPAGEVVDGDVKDSLVSAGEPTQAAPATPAPAAEAPPWAGGSSAPPEAPLDPSA